MDRYLKIVPWFQRQGFWQPPSTLDAADPQIPWLPLLDGAAPPVTDDSETRFTVEQREHDAVDYGWWDWLDQVFDDAAPPADDGLFRDADAPDWHGVDDRFEYAVPDQGSDDSVEFILDAVAVTVEAREEFDYYVLIAEIIEDVAAAPDDPETRFTVEAEWHDAEQGFVYTADENTPDEPPIVVITERPPVIATIVTGRLMNRG